jgi:hypothetical protein
MSTYTPFIGESDRDTPEHNVVRPSTPMMWTPTAVGGAVLLAHTKAVFSVIQNAKVFKNFRHIAYADTCMKY